MLQAARANAEHQLTDEQIRIYDSYAGAFAIIHNNLTAAKRAANITGAMGTLNAQAKSAARSAFESAKQRFFNHLITAMKTSSLIALVERDMRDGHAAVTQIVSTGEALMERRVAEIPTEEWGDVQIDITPREYVLDYLAHSFPTQLYEPFTDSEGNLSSRPAFRDGQPVQCRDAAARRDLLIEKLPSLTPVHGALDQIVQRFGTDNVKAEKRFLSTIARRLDTLGAITKGQRQTGGQGLFRPEDNLESHYARDALRQLYVLLVAGKVRDCSLQIFEDTTGLKLIDSNGIKDEFAANHHILKSPAGTDHLRNFDINALRAALRIQLAPEDVVRFLSTRV
jgi:hypothetical protein